MKAIIKATAYYVWTFWRRGIFPFLWGTSIAIVLAGGWFLSQLALLEQSRIVVAWCMSIWHGIGMLNFLACYHAYTRYCRSRSVDGWYVSLQNQPVLQHIAVFVSMVLIHLGIYVMCLFSGGYLEWLVSGNVSWHMWGHWLIARFFELLLMGALLQWAYAPHRISVALNDTRHELWKSSLSVGLIIATAYASPWLRSLISYARQRELYQASLSDFITGGVEWFLRVLPPFYLVDRSIHTTVEGLYYMYLMGYLLLLLGCGIWRVRLSGRT